MSTAGGPAPALLMQLLDALRVRQGDAVGVIGADPDDALQLLGQRSGHPALRLGTPIVTAVPPLDALLVLDGCSHAPWPWLCLLKPGGRAVFALLGQEGSALYWQVRRPVRAPHTHWPAHPVTLADIAPCPEHWDACEAALIDALGHQLLEVRSLTTTACDGLDMVLVEAQGAFSRRVPRRRRSS